MSLLQDSQAHFEKAKGALGDKLAIFQKGMETMRSEGLGSKAPKVGETAPDFTLPDAYGKTVSLAGLLKKGPVVVSFYRGEWCPFCNLELRAFQQILPKLEAAGATLVAVSPEKPEWSQLAGTKNELTFPVLQDQGNEVARRYGLVFVQEQAVSDLQKGKFGLDVAARNGAVQAELPVPGTFVIDSTGVVRYSHADPDYMLGRAEPEDVLHTVEALQGSPAAA